jgi:hypothetical protein
MVNQVQGKVYLGNAFSLSMIEVQDKPVTVEFRKVSIDEVKAISSSGFVSAVGHPGTASALSRILSVEVPANRVSIQLQPGDTLIVFQLALGRLPLGKELTEEEILNAWKEGKAYFLIVRVLV